jgi:CBS domain-containing protein
VPQTLKDLMTPNPLTVSTDTPLVDAARAMRDRDIGDVIVTDGSSQVCGIVTDRDIVVRGIADGRDPTTTKVGDICSADLVTLSPDDDVDQAVTVMRERALRRLPIVEDGRAVGIVSIGDLAMERDSSSALADISAAPGNT